MRLNFRLSAQQELQMRVLPLGLMLIFQRDQVIKPAIEIIIIQLFGKAAANPVSQPIGSQ
jgi:hypothetical protein